jgi:site-specific DNA-methyltransferase (adenine-specific)
MGNNLQLFETHSPEGFHDAEWSTPLVLFKGLDDEFHFTLDVCASPSNAKCDRFFTIHDDGLSQPWAPAVCWMNPPYSRGIIDLWMKKALKESRGGQR